MSKLSRRSLVTSAAALPAFAMPAAAALAHEPDPIFAAIEKERVLDAAWLARFRYEENLKEMGYELTPAPNEYRTKELAAAVNASMAARAELANTAPTTLAGMVAYLDYVLSQSDDELMFDGDDETQDFVRSLARAAKQIAREAVQS